MKQSTEVLVRRKSGITERVVLDNRATLNKKGKSNFGIHAAKPAPVLSTAEDLKNFIFMKAVSGTWNKSQQKRNKMKTRKKKKDMMDIALLVPRIG